MSRPRLNLSDAIAEAGDFTRDAWRDVWAVLLIVVIGETLIFMGDHVAQAEWRPGLWPMLGQVLRIAYVPLFGALYRLGVGGEAMRSLGRGGLQWTGIEWRLLGVWAMLLVALGICAAPLAVVSAPLIFLFRHHTALYLGPLGSWSVAAVVLAPVWFVFGVFILNLGGRMGLTNALAVERRRVFPLHSWSMTRGLGWSIGLGWLVVQAPTMLGWLALGALNLIEANDLGSGFRAYWPLPEGTLAGVLFGLVSAAVQAPLSVGFLTSVHHQLGGHPDVRHAAPRSHAVLSAEETAAASALAANEASELGLSPSFDDAPPPVDLSKPLSIWPHSVLPMGSMGVSAEAIPETLAPDPKADQTSADALEFGHD